MRKKPKVYINECKLSLIFVIIYIFAVLFFNSCRSISTHRPVLSALEHNKDGKKSSTIGIPYFLPTSLLEISFESKRNDDGKHQELIVNTSAKLVPDPKQLYVLDSVKNAFFQKKHKIKLTDGMLSLITTEDESKTNEFIASLISTATNVFSFNAIGGIPEGKQYEKGELPTQKEIIAAYESITPGLHSYTLPKESQETLQILGTEELLFLTVRSNAVLGSIISPDLPGDRPEGEDIVVDVDENTTDNKPKNAGGLLESDNGRQGQDQTLFNGIYTRVFTPIKITINVSMKLTALYQKRITETKDSIKSIEKELKSVSEQINDKGNEQKIKENELIKIENKIKEFKKKEKKLKELQAAETQGTPPYQTYAVEIEFLSRKLETSKEEKNSLETSIKTIKKSLTTLYDAKREKKKEKQEKETYLKKNEEWRENPKIDGYEIAKRESILLVPDENVIVKVPIKKSPLGKTTHTITLNSGVLVEYQTEYPSAALEFIKIPLNLSKTLLELPTQILQLKINYTNKEKELTQAIKEQNELLVEIEQEKAIKNLEQEKNFLELTKSIESLHKEIKDIKQDPSSQELEITAMEIQLRLLELERDLAKIRKEIDELNNK